jgi:hypothetical protein
MIQPAIRIHDRMVIELDSAIVKMANVKSGELFSQAVTKDGILLRRIETEERTLEDSGERKPSKASSPEPRGKRYYDSSNSKL